LAKIKPSKEISEGKKALQEIMQKNLSLSAEKLIDEIISKYRRLTNSQKIDAISGQSISGQNKFRGELLVAMSIIAGDAIDGARKEVPRAKNVKLAEDIESIRFGEFEKLPLSVQKDLNQKSNLLVGKQLSDLERAIFFSFNTNYPTTDSESVLRKDLEEGAEEFITSNSVSTGAAITSAKIVNEARAAFFYDDNTLEEIDAFQFVNGDPVSPICQDLAGKIFAKDDPEARRYQPPLHWNCKSYMVPILKGNLRGREVEKLVPSKSDLNKFVQFSESDFDSL
jgi:SPP1 gp7 family putative phage head morphogenesis protein